MGLCLRFWLSAADCFLCLFIFFPLAVFHWRGTWGLQDVYIFPDDLVISSWISLAAGSCLSMAGYFTQPLVRRFTTLGSVKYLVASRLLLYVQGWAVMCYWRGVWNLMDNYLGEGWINSALIYAGCEVLSLATRTSRTNVGLPFAVNLDIEDDLMQPDIAVNVDTSVPWKFILAGFYTQFVIITSNIAIWRGIWNILDAFLFPDDPLTSYVSSLILGYLILFQIFILEYPASVTAIKLDEFPKRYKIIFEDIIVFVATWATLLVWRGAWDLTIDYVIPDPLVGGWICHWIGTIGLMVPQVFRNVATNGIDRDGAYKGGEGVYPTKYIRFFLADKLKLKVEIPEDEYMIIDAGSVLSDDEINGDSGIFTTEDGSVEVGNNLYRSNRSGYLGNSGNLDNPRQVLVTEPPGSPTYGSADERIDSDTAV